MSPITASTTLSTPVARRRTRLTARGRRVVALLALLPMLMIGGVMAAQPTLAADESASATLDTVTVQGGDTLWSIAESITTTRDVRDVVIEIIRLNALDGATVQPGQHLVLPAER